MAATRVQVKFNRVGAARAQIEREMGRRVEQAAQDMRSGLRAQMEGGGLPLGPDTGALATSLFVQSPQGSDYQERSARALNAYTQSASRYRDAVREEVTSEAYTAGHFLERLATEEALGQAPQQARASVGTGVGYGAMWQFGHHNLFTGRDESPRDWFVGPAEAWARANMGARFKALLK